ncbi:Fatty acid oxidation complex subunit alpha [Vibrio stylophorae]|uniref:enoyl-CoA hydratase n=1 Tax=Vibrio stylophorae TaxID=659351 RepID=A0ABM8ZWN5_9VIBR|nr:fatty acid oxidation complex subunit alpha FadB [Vibrio stylophorae]CAH0534744.1 Fatty acid oxidation complex subunit alpha [Vibrio stylophorae]
MGYISETIVVREHEDAIAELCFCAPSHVNVLSLDTLGYLEQAVDYLQAQPHLKALILTSDKPSFIVGANIHEFLNLFSGPSEHLKLWLNRANHVFNNLSALPFPTIVAIDGHALGGGCELALACDFRIATPRANIGLPETKLGIIPGFGGTVRLPRVIGLDSAMALITQGKTLRATQALEQGLIDAIVAPEQLFSSACKLAHSAMTLDLDWQQRRTEKAAPLPLSQVELTLSEQCAKSITLQQSGGHYPAPMAAIQSLIQGAPCNADEALAIETQIFAHLVDSDSTRALVGLFLADQVIKQQAKQYGKTEAPERVGVLGAGIMGGGISYQAALTGSHVVMKDIAQPALDHGMNEASKRLTQLSQRGRINAQQLSDTLTRIQPTLSEQPLADRQLVIEAVVENAEVKAKVLSQLEQQVDAHTILASNTSTIAIDQLAQSLQRPENFCGMHFFNPVHRMPLVEVIRGRQTSDKAIAQVVALAQKMKKTAIVVGDCPGFFVNRVLFPYFLAFDLLLAQGEPLEKIDRMMSQSFGWPMGPGLLLDVIGLDTAHHAMQVMAAGYPERMQGRENNFISQLHQAQCWGQKNEQGFYRYHLDKRGRRQQQINPQFQQWFGAPQDQLSTQQVMLRMMAPLLNEVVRCLAEGIIDSPEAADMALVYGLGFPPFRGGPCRYLDSIGIAHYLEQIAPLEAISPLYQAPQKLHEMAAQQTGFYPLTQEVAYA